MNEHPDETRDGTFDENHDETSAAYDPPRDETLPLSTMLTGNGVDEPERRTHPLSVGHLVCGLVFLGIAASWGLRQVGAIDADGDQWVLPLVLVIAGGAGLLALVAKQLTGSRS